MRATTYHINSQDGRRIVGGTLGSDMDLNAAAMRLVAELDVAVLPSGRVSFMRNGAPVYAYLSVSPEDTEKARAAIAADRQRCAAEAAARLAKQAELDDLLDALTVDEAIARLKGEQP